MNVEIAQRLSARRKQAGLSQESLAEKLGVSRQAVSKWERSESSPDTDNLIALAQLYGVSLDDLLYVDDEMRDDVVFEAADRASCAACVPLASDNKDGEDDSRAQADSEGNNSARADGEDKKVHVGFDGIHVLDGDDYVHLSWREGVHVKDGKKGEEVHVGWDGIHVKEPAAPDTSRCASDQNTRAEHCTGVAGEWFDVDCNGAGGCDDEGNEFVMNGDGVVINGEHFDSWQDAHAKYGSEVDAKIPGHKHYLKEFERAWVKFPYPLVVILAYILLGIFNGAWGMGLFLFFTIPVYYMVGHAIGRKRIAPLIEGVYPLAVVAWFFYMAFVLNQWHPAWVAFLTIPLVEWLVHSLSHWWRNCKRRRNAAKCAPIDVEAK